MALNLVDPATGGQGVGVVGSPDPQPGVEDLPEFGLGLGGLALEGQHCGDVVPGGQGVRVVGSQDPQLGVEDLPEFSSFDLASLKDLDGLGQLAGLPGAAAELEQDTPGLELGVGALAG
jgi:hypothetical protein